MRVIPNMPDNPVDLKKTINLPRTDFPMKANLPQAEPKILARWEQEKLYEKIRQARAGHSRLPARAGNGAAPPAGSRRALAVPSRRARTCV